MTMFVEDSLVLDFLKANQNLENEIDLDWDMAIHTLKNLRVKVPSSNGEYKIIGLSEKICKEQTFTLKNKTTSEEVEITVSDYFKNKKNTTLEYSGNYPCINVGKPKRPIYFPIELCKIVSRQELSVKMDVITTLTGPNTPREGIKNFNDKKFVKPANIKNWVCVNFSATCDTRELIQNLMTCAKLKGINIDDPLCVIEEDEEFKDKPANIRVDQMFDKINSVVPESSLTFILCILSKSKNSDVYGPWKKRNLFEHGIVTQCITPPKKLNDKYLTNVLTNVLMKINAKLGGLNYLVDIEEQSQEIPLVTEVPTMIIGMHVYNGSPSLASVVSSREWPYISKYKACVRTQPPKVEMIGNLFKLNYGTDEDEGIFRELLSEFISSSKGKIPMQIIIFRDGVSESQFPQVLDIELDQIMKACEHYDKDWNPKFTVIVAQKNQAALIIGSSDNVYPGTIINDGNTLFNLNAKGEKTGTTKLTYYYVLKNDIGFSRIDLQELVHSLSNNFQRSTRPISIVAPIQYAHLAASQMATVMKSKDNSENSASHSGITAPGAIPVGPMPELHDNIASSMFFC